MPFDAFSFFIISSLPILFGIFPKMIIFITIDLTALENAIVEIEESLFTKRKNNIGHVLLTQCFWRIVLLKLQIVLMS